MKNEKRKKIIKISAVLMGAALGILGRVALTESAEAWGPERTTYTNESPAPQAVFNSITNNAAVGDERDFVRIVEVHEDGTKDTYANEIEVSAGKTYEVYIYYHNDASSTFNTRDYEYRGVAREAKISAAFPETLKAGERKDVNAIISSSTTLVPKVWDEAYMTATEDLTFAYVRGSAKIFNDWGANGSVLSDNLFSADGTYIGLDELNGLILGCDEYSGQVVFRIQAFGKEAEPEPTPTAGFEMDKKVRKGNGEWMDEIEVKPGDEIEFRVHFKNTGTVSQKEVKIVDTLEGAAGTSYIAGTTRIVRDGHETTVASGDDKLFGGGIDLGEIGAGGEIEVLYKVKIDTLEGAFKCGKTVLYNLAGVSGRRGDDAEAGTATMYDKVKITVVKEGGGCLPAELPETGPAQIILAGVVIAGILVGAGYWLSSRRQLRKLEEEARGEKKGLKKKRVKKGKAQEVKPENEAEGKAETGRALEK